MICSKSSIIQCSKRGKLDYIVKPCYFTKSMLFILGGGEMSYQISKKEDFLAGERLAEASVRKV